MKKVVFVSIFIFLSWMCGFSQVVATFQVNAGKFSRSNTPVCADITYLTSIPDSILFLEEIAGKTRRPVPYQFEHGQNRILWWILDGETKAGVIRTFQLVKGSKKNLPPQVNVKKENGTLLVTVGKSHVLRYNYITVDPPEGVSPYYRRSGFIHPLWSPGGAVLTAIQPKDHYHHYGIWNPWTKTSVEGNEIDFWNLNRRLGTVRFAEFGATASGAVFGGFKALHQHVIYPDSSAEKLAMTEIWDVRVFNVAEKGYLIEFTSSLNVAADKPIILEEYRYGGFGYRATGLWTNQNSKALTSEGKTRKDADGSTARWAWVNGNADTGMAGVLFMSFPLNYNHPEPIRMWPEDANNGRGDVFFNFSPTKNKSWKLNPGETYALKYRLFVFDGEIITSKCESLWSDFAAPPVVTVK